MNQLVSKEVYRFLFENSFDAIFLTSPDGSIHRANPVACEMLQRTEEEICRIGRAGVVELNDPRLDERLKERISKGKIRTELNFIRKDGSVFPTELTSTIFRDEEGRIWIVIIIRDMSLLKASEDALRKAHEEATYYATYDSLTGTLNRRAFMVKLQQEISRASREKNSVSLLLLDIDYFKEINDTQGHGCGDKVLRDVAEMLTEKIRPYDIIGRFGGDEFIVCLPNTTLPNARIVAERLRSDAEDIRISCESERVWMTVSIGLVCYESGTDEDVNTLIMRVDKNLYTAKETRNTVFGA